MGQWNDILHMDKITGVHVSLDHVHWLSACVAVREGHGDMIYSVCILGVIAYSSEDIFFDWIIFLCVA